MPLAKAQGVFKVVGPDGKVTFTDMPPSAATHAPVTAVPSVKNSGNAGPDLPYALRQAMGKYPVTLYTTAACSGCDAGRALLTTRGIPFTERTVSTAEESQALAKLAGEPILPTATIGTHHLRGINASEWNQYLDAAGYPQSSVLPKSYRPADATPLLSRPSAAPPKTATTEKPARNPPPAPSPSGIQF
ncbi:MAG: glutaredoxin family protein [Rhodoferax sp.]|nr:glutaredoxin family protein [Rhodoferax sp.]